MVVKDANDNPATTYTLRRKAGRNIIEHQPVFSPDGESLVVIVENIVRVYNIKTGDITRTLETETPVDELISIQFPENEAYNLYGCSDTGRVTTWTWENGGVLRETQLALPQYQRVHSFHLLDNNNCFVTTCDEHIKNFTLAVYAIRTGQVVYTIKDHDIYYYEGLTKVAIGKCYGETIAALVNGSPVLTVCNLEKPHKHQKIFNLSHVRIVAVAAHSTTEAIATLDASGKTVIYRGNFFQPKSLAKEVVHWHSLPTFAACFSLEGSYLYTGGMEKVIVKWTLGSLANRAQEKIFMPRLPGSIRYLTVNNSYVAATLSNNSIVIATARLQIVSTILECGGLSPAARALATSLVYHQRLAGLLIGGRTGHLQLYSTATDKLLYNIDITNMNQIPAARCNLIPLETEITCAAVSGNGSWLVTSEYRNDGVNYPEERLKFWALKIKSSASPFTLRTCVNLSHGGCNVVSIALNYRGEFCVSAGTDQKFRIWKRDLSEKKNQGGIWFCLTACYYSSGIAQFLSHDILNKYKSDPAALGTGDGNINQPYMRKYSQKDDILAKVANIHKEHGLLSQAAVNPGMQVDDVNAMGGVDISHDGSLIAAWFGCKLTLWDTHLCNLRTTLSHPALRPKGVHVKFGYQDAAHYLVCTTADCVAVWTLLSLTVKWLVPLRTVCLTADPFSNKMAVATPNNDVYIFTPHNSTPILTHNRLLDPRTGVIKQCTFGPSSGDDARLYLMRNDAEVFCLEPEQTSSTRVESITPRNLPTGGFSALLASQVQSDVRGAKPTNATSAIDTPALASTAVAQFLSAAPHMIPPVSLLSTAFLQHISGHQETEEAEEQEETPMDVDQSSDDEEEGTKTQLNGPYAPKAAQLWIPNYEKIKEKRLQRIVTEPIQDLQAAASIFS